MDIRKNQLEILEMKNIHIVSNCGVDLLKRELVT